MLKGKTIVELAQQLQDIKENAKDYMVPTSLLKMDAETNELHVGKEILKPSGYAHGQIASYVGIPKQYYDRIREENPALLADNVNHGLERKADVKRGEKPENRLVRAYKGEVRALLSSSYRRLDSYDLMQTVLPVVQDNGLQIVSSEITEQRVYLKALSPKIQAEVKKDDVVQYGLMISNSDVGAGSVRVEPLIYRLVCLNGMIMNTSIRKFHVGRNMAGDDFTELLTQETLNLTDQAFWAQVKDILLSTLTQENFEREVNKLRDAAAQKITNFDLPEVVDVTMKTLGVDGKNIKDNVIAYLANGADGAGLTKWGLANGFTYAAHAGGVGYDASIELERVGARIIELPKNQWERISA